MIAVAPLPAHDAPAWAHLTFPLFRPQLQEPEVLCVAASCAGQPVGLAVARRGRAAQLLSIAVASTWRGRGVAGRLLAATEAQLRAGGADSVEAIYIAGQPSTPALERLLQRHDFAPPQPRMLVCRTRIANLVEAPLVTARRPPRRGRIVGWDEMGADIRDALREEAGRPGACPDWAWPFFDEARIEPANSVVLEHLGRVLGFLVNHRIAADTVRYSRLFLFPGAARGSGFALAGESVWRQHERLRTQAPKGSCDLEVANRMMLNFLGRHLRPWLTSVAVSKVARKVLVPQAKAVGDPAR